jgi:hypothetical protein
MRPAYSTPAKRGRGAGTIDETTKQYDGIVYMPCNPENDFFPELSLAKVRTHMPTRPRAVRLTSCARLVCAGQRHHLLLQPEQPHGRLRQPRADHPARQLRQGARRVPTLRPPTRLEGPACVRVWRRARACAAGASRRSTVRRRRRRHSRG